MRSDPNPNAVDAAKEKPQLPPRVRHARFYGVTGDMFHSDRMVLSFFVETEAGEEIVRRSFQIENIMQIAAAAKDYAPHLEEMWRKRHQKQKKGADHA